MQAIWQTGLVMFEEIPSPAAPPSQRSAFSAFVVIFASFLVGSAIAWFRWSYPLSVIRKIVTAEFVLGLVFSGACLVTAKSATPEDNRKRLWSFLWAIMLFQLILDVLQ
jgi:hypothetical protein